MVISVATALWLSLTRAREAEREQVSEQRREEGVAFGAGLHPGHGTVEGPKTGGQYLQLLPAPLTVPSCQEPGLLVGYHMPAE